MVKKTIYFMLALCLTLAVALPASAREFTPDPTRYERDMLRFERADAENYPAPGCIVFMGSSSIKGWKTLQEDFKGMDVVLRGYGGSQISDAIFYVERIVVPYHPTAIVLYAGDNDIGGKGADVVVADFKEYVRTVNSFIGPRAIYFIAIKPSIARWKQWPEMQKANAAIEQWAATQDAVYYLDIATPMLGEDGKPRPELFQEDGLHMTREGYTLWTEVIKPKIVRK
jgi:lysophospholipase L1-like esterase